MFRSETKASRLFDPKPMGGTPMPLQTPSATPALRWIRIHP
jgi:hypothetical protein